MFGASTSGGTGLFGASQTKPAASFGSAPAAGNAGFLFGSTANNTNTSNAPGGTSGFSFGGSTGQTNPPLNNTFGASNTNQSGGLFGSGTANNTSGGLFGTSSNNSASNNAPSGGLFGSSTNSGQQTQTQQALGGLFGGGNNQNTTLGGLFGAKPAAPASATGTNTGGLFGAAGSSNNTMGSSSGGLFGKPASGGLFGSSTSQNNPPSGGLFGNTNNSSNNTTNATGGLFGNNTASNSTGGLFGNKPAANTSTTSGGLFGNTANTAGSASAPFGGSAASAPTGLANANNAQPSFNWSTQKQNNTPMANSTLSQTAQAPTQAQQSVSTYIPAVNDQVLRLKEQWDPSSAKCALTTHLYNKVTEAEMSALLQQPRPANESPEEWENAMANRPGPLYYPIKVSSFSEVAQRVEVQLEHVAKSRILLRSINDKMDQLSSKHDLDNSTRIMRARAKHTNLSRRLLRLATVLAVLRLKGYPLLPEEEEISKQLQTLLAKISDPNGSVGKLSDIYARLAIIKGRSEDLSNQMDSTLNYMNGTLSLLTGNENEMVSDGTPQINQVAELLTKLLYKQQIGLSYLNDVVQKDVEIVDKAESKR